MIGKDTKSTEKGENEGSLSLFFSLSPLHLLDVMSIQILGNLHASLSRLHFLPPVKALCSSCNCKMAQDFGCLVLYHIYFLAYLISLFKSQFQPESLCKSITNSALLKCSSKTASPNNTLFYGSSLIPSRHKNPCFLSTALKRVTQRPDLMT